MKRYVWDDDKTPYLVEARALSRRQARSELFVYTLFLGTLFIVESVWLGSARAPGGAAPGMSLYCFSVTCAALILGFTRNREAAWWCAASPLVLLGYLFVAGFPSQLARVDQFVIVALLALLARYGWRVIAIARHYPDLEDPPVDEA